jgi:K+-transporting ATPase ATPase C chain
MLTHLRPALVLLALMIALTGIAYPLAITGVAQVALSGPANGSMIERNGVVVGSDIIGQPFASDRYFQPRPSATSATDPNDSTKTVDAPYNAAGSGGSNLGPTSKKLVDRVKEDQGARASRTARSGTGRGSGRGPHSGLHRRAARERTPPQPRARRASAVD